ncbi:uncharacterized protein [Leptinotarsa decemlineata]|uniref:uncharacterized protein n=1 Tax=Leptinotarsa decemlineata TaxID=7539 RepID=UPI003D3057A7
MPLLQGTAEKGGGEQQERVGEMEQTSGEAIFTQVQEPQEQVKDTPPTIENTYPGCCQIIRQAYLLKGVPEKATGTILASLSPATQKQYNTTYSKWWKFCRGVDVFDTCENKIIQFLQTEFDAGASYASLNTHKSALCTLLNFEAKVLSRFLRGIFRSRPTFPKYNETWDPNPVLAYLSTLSPLESLTLKNLTIKLVVLLALATAQRVQTLSKIKLSNISRFDDRIEIRITDILKTSASNKVQPILILPYFFEKPHLCVASVMDYYMKTTNNLGNNSDQLLITIKTPHHPATTQTISRWIKSGLNQSGVDSSMFTGHSTRHASTSYAFKKGVNIETIRKAAGWSNKSNTFSKFYNKPIQSGNFAKYIFETEPQ